MWNEALIQNSADSDQKLDLDPVPYYAVVWESHLYAISTKITIQNTLYIAWSLLSVNNICDLLRNTWRKTE